jgi:cold shock CspA family protein
VDGGDIKENNKVQFEIGRNQKGLAAINVKKA